jgi:hypothetical protein
MKNFRHTRILIAFASIAALLAGAAVAQAASNKSSVKKAVSWTKKADLSAFPGTGFQSDTISSLVAARKIGVKVPSSTVSRFLTEVKKDTADYASSAGSAAKLILAAVATEQNPRCFGPSKATSSDLRNILTADYDANTGQFGETAFDQGFALLAMKAAHERVPSKAIKFAQNRRGKYGWNFTLSKSAGDDVEPSALMIEALRANGVSKNSSSLKSAYKWITYQRNQDGGYNPDMPQGVTQADTTSYVLRAFDALGISNKYSKSAQSALRALQANNGGFRSTPGDKGAPGIATGNAILALSGQHYPVRVRSKAGKSCGA